MERAGAMLRWRLGGYGRTVAALVVVVQIVWTAPSVEAAPPDPSASGKPPVILAIDAEFGVKAATSAQAIQQGAELAAAEINAAGGVLGGRPLKIVIRNNNSVPARAAENLRELAADPNVVAVMGGKHSPVYEHLLPMVTEIGIPYLNPWAASDPLTDHPYRPNYLFRLSMKDSWAMQALLAEAKKRNAKKIGVLVPNGGWGRSSLAAVAALAGKGSGIKVVSQQWYNFGDTFFQTQLAALRRSGAQALILVANEIEGAALVREMAALPRADRVPMLSHWGVTGGQFFTLAGTALAEVDFMMVQTYSFIDARDDNAKRVLAGLLMIDPSLTARRIKSPVGLAHAYDLTHLLAMALRVSGSTDRSVLRSALENLPEYRGLVRRYARPFSAERHDALDPSVVFMARYAPDGAIERIR